MANDGTVKIGTELDDSGFKSGLSKLGSVASGALKSTVAVVGSVATAASGAVAGLLALESATEEYRVAQGKLNTAFEAAGYNTDQAARTYKAFYQILGDTDTATEASQLLAKLSLNGKDMIEWTNIAAGVWGTFGDSLPIEGLIESANETARVGTVTGVLADALNWASISEDEFNEKLAACTSESERNQLIMNTLSATYDEAADVFYRNNEALIASRNAQAQMDDALATLGAAVTDVKTKMTAEFLPAISEVTAGLAGMLTGTEGAEEQFSNGIRKIIDTAVEMLPEFLDFGVQILTAILNGIIQNVPQIVSAVPTVIQSFASAFMEMLPEIVSSGKQIIGQIVAGLSEALPELIPAAAETVVSFIEWLLDNIDIVIDGAVELILALAEGLIDALPVLLEKAPEIIVKLVAAIIENGPKLVAAAIELMAMLATGLLEGFRDILSKISGWVDENIIQPIKGKISDMKEIGKNLLEGLWNGISDKVEWLKDKVSGVVDTIKGWFTGSDGFDTHSPSKWSMSVMEYVMEGLAIGAKNRAGEVLETVDDIIQEIKDRVSSISDALSLRQDVGDLQYELWERTIGSAATEEEKYAKQLELLQQQQADQENIIEAAAAAYQAVSDQYGENSAESYEYQKTLLEEMLAYQDLIDKINEVIAAKQELANTDISSAIPYASEAVYAANSSITPVSASIPQFTTENALAQAAGIMAMSQTNNSERPFIIEMNGREVARGVIPNIRAVEKQTPEIQFN